MLFPCSVSLVEATELRAELGQAYSCRFLSPLVHVPNLYALIPDIFSRIYRASYCIRLGPQTLGS